MKNAYSTKEHKSKGPVERGRSPHCCKVPTTTLYPDARRPLYNSSVWRGSSRAAVGLATGVAGADTTPDPVLPEKPAPCRSWSRTLASDVTSTSLPTRST